ncbi:hypothetical protein BDV95DRAFT_592490 [Massariosphaeria phaeospora]|uniref:Uncharacterized protein n=1 Tax=Massariosphaeria phaeospora TaxID=100035 RepID=A0A7C8IJJ8_9PLEO|nr:hypothetical protein BDV95DRAFT_592490 [Massariosphaeria phaeospora]
MVTHNAPNVWQQMQYVPPQGPCNYKLSLMSPKCPCLRFMLHPLKSGSSFECDGCSHHASFHSMENKAEDEIRKRWEQEARDKDKKQQEEDQVASRPKKRLREIEYNTGAAKAANVRLLGNGVVPPDEDDASVRSAAEAGKTTTRRPKPRRAPARARGARNPGTATEISDDDEFIEVD